VGRTLKEREGKPANAVFDSGATHTSPIDQDPLTTSRKPAPCSASIRSPNSVRIPWYPSRTGTSSVYAK